MTGALFGLLQAVAGGALAIAGVRSLSRAIDDTAANRLRDLLIGVVDRIWGAYGVGVLSAVALQASAATVLTAVALVHRGVLPLESAVFVMLGATLGTTLKGWLLAWPASLALPRLLGPVMVAGASLALVVTRQAGRRRLADAVFAIGLIFVGWNLAATGFERGALGVVWTDWISGQHVGELSRLMVTICAGFLAAALTQSSSAVLIVVLGLVGQGTASVPVGVALILGANVGSAVTPLIASLEYRSPARSLAVLHFLVKAVGVALAGLFFRSFLATSMGLADALGATSPALHVVMAHTLFNALNSVIWLPIAPALARSLGGPQHERRRPFLARSVRRMIAGLPVEAGQEIAKERDACLRATKVYVDDIVRSLRSPARARVHTPRDLRARVLGAQEIIAEVVVRSTTPEGGLDGALSELNTLEELVDEASALLGRVEGESARVRDLRVSHLLSTLDAYEQGMHAAWGAIVDPSRPTPSRVAFTAVERSAYQHLQSLRRLEEADWIEVTHQIAHLQRIWSRTHDLVDLRRRGPRESAGDEAEGA